MANGVLLSWLATGHDPFYSRKDRIARCTDEGGAEPGPSLQLITDPTWGPRFQRYVLLYQPEHEAQARGFEVAARERRPDLEIDLQRIELTSPINHGEIFAALSSLASRLNAQFPPVGTEGRSVEGHEYFLSISQGTPAMHAVWMILVQAEILRARMLQTVPPMYLKSGEPCAREVMLDLTKSPMPVVQGLKRTGVREYELRRQHGPQALLASFMAANIYGPTDDYGLYLLTHNPSSPEQVEACLGHIDQDLRQIQEHLSPGGLQLIQDYIASARESFRGGFEKFQAWSLDHREALKKRFRFSFRDWINGATETYRGLLEISASIAEEAAFFFTHEIYCEADIVRRGLDVIVENASAKAYTEDHDGPRKLAISFGLREENLIVVLEDFGHGFTEIAMNFQKEPGTSGGGLRDLRKMERWFQGLTVESTCRVSYDVKQGKQIWVPGPGTGTRFTITFRLPRERSARPVERGIGRRINDRLRPPRLVDPEGTPPKDRTIDSILIVDSRDAGQVEARLPRILAALREFSDRSSCFTTTWLIDGSDYHDLDAFDLALVHQSDAVKDGRVFYDRCVQGNKPCVLYSGDIDAARAESERLLIVRDFDVLAHAEAGVLFLERFGRLSLIAWTRGYQAACRGEVSVICNRLRQPFLLPNPTVEAFEDWDSTVEQLRNWSGDPRFLSRVDRLRKLSPTSPEESGTILEVLDELPRYA